MTSGSTEIQQDDASRTARLERAKAFAIEAARLAADLRCRDVKALDVRGISPLCDYIVLATGASDRQIRAVATQIEEVAGPHDLQATRSQKRVEGSTTWVAVDFVDVMVHVLSDDARDYYDLDNLWGDGKQVPWFEGREKSAAGAGPEAKDHPDTDHGDEVGGH